jgi:hypothetical protein
MEKFSIEVEETDEVRPESEDRLKFRVEIRFGHNLVSLFTETENGAVEIAKAVRAHAVHGFGFDSFQD